MKDFFSVAIDGPAGAGKSSVAERVAKKFKIFHLDTGALYRAIGFYFLNVGKLTEENLNFQKELKYCNLELKFNEGIQQIFVNGDIVDEYIRNSEVAKAASFVSQNFEVREYVLKIEREFAKNNGVVMDGRDIGTVVLPDADVKIFLTASLKVRALRRFEELKFKGFNVNSSDVLKEIKARDLNDVKRKIAPLKIAKDAIIVNNDNLTLEQSVERVESFIYKILLKEQKN